MAARDSTTVRARAATAALVALVSAGGCGRAPGERVSREGSTADDPLGAVDDRDLEGITSVMLMQRGATILERHLGGADASTLHDVRSVTKSVAGLALGVALADGAIPSVDAPALAFLADLRPFRNPGRRKDEITLADLLTMSSALDCDDDDPDSPGNEENMYPERSWSRWAVDLPVRGAYVRDAAGRGPFAYCTAGVFLLGQVIERATGTRFDRLVERRLFAPLGIGPVEWRRSPSGEVQSAGQLRLRTADLARLGLLVLARGRRGATQVVPAAWIDRMLTMQRRPGPASDPRGELGYGYLVWRREYATPCGPKEGWYMSGNGGTHVVVLRDLDAVAVVTAVNFNERGMHDRTTHLIERHLLPRLRCPY